MIVTILSLLDIVAGILLAFSMKGIIISAFGMLILIKGVSSIIGNLTHKNLLDWMGWIDLITGVLLYFGFIIPWFWVIVILKGLYSFVFSFKK